MDFQVLANSKSGVVLGSIIGGKFPSVLSYPLINFVARRLARSKTSPMVQVVRNNQKIVHGGPLSSISLDKLVEEVFVHAGRCFVDLYKNYNNPEALQRKIYVSEDIEKLIRLSQGDNFGAFLVVPHMSNFDLMLLAVAARGFKAKVLTLGNPTGGYKFQNEIRATSGLDIMPVSRRANINALRTLQNGGIVLAGIDRPIREKGRKLSFFGRPSPLSDGYIRMALRADVPVLVANVYMDEDGIYQTGLSEPVTMTRMDDSAMEVRYNAEKVLSVIEDCIRCHPTQWQMYYPVWPDVVDF